MAMLRTGGLCLLLFVFSHVGRSNDSLTAAQAFVNLRITGEYIKTLDTLRIAKIISFIEAEMDKIRSPQFIRNNQLLYNSCLILIRLEKAQLALRSGKPWSRASLLQYKGILDTTRMLVDRTRPLDILAYSSLPFYNFIAFDDYTFPEIARQAWSATFDYGNLFNRNIYPDFQRIFYHHRNRGLFHFDSLQYFANLFGMPLDLSVLKATRTPMPVPEIRSSLPYRMDPALQLISEYLQLNYIVEKGGPIDTTRLYLAFEDFKRKVNPGDTLDFRLRESVFRKDRFFNRELNQAVLDSLEARVKGKFPYRLPSRDTRDDREVQLPYIPEKKIFFPYPAPFPSARGSVKHFRPALKKMKAVDGYIRNVLDQAAYGFRYQYHYAVRGFAITTNLERIDANGKPAADDTRWQTTVTQRNKFSLYYFFKTIFFAGQGHFRIIALVISPEQYPSQQEASGFKDIVAAFEEGYPSLPQDIENFELQDKTLSVFIYHFYQDDIGLVPRLDVSRRLSVADHFRSSRLMQLLNP